MLYIAKKMLFEISAVGLGIWWRGDYFRVNEF